MVSFGRQDANFQKSEVKLERMQKFKKSAAIQMIGGIVLLVLLVVKLIVPMGPSIPVHISMIIMIVSVASIYTGIYQLKK